MAVCPRVLAVLVVVAAAAASVPVAAEPVPVVVAVDTSRSLTPGDMAEIRERLTAALAQLPAGTPAGLVAFADQARWVVPLGASTADVVAGLDGLAPEGTTTVLHDALFIAVREMPTGGVVLVVTDGRDEGSATTVEDVARLAESHGVPVVAASHGRRTDLRALRRLGLLTDGAFVGPLSGSDGAELAGIVTAVAAAVEAAREPPAEEAAPAAAESPPVLEPTPVPERIGVERTLPAWMLPATLAAIVVAVVAVILAGRARQRKRVRICERCGVPLQPWDTECPRCQMVELEEAARTQPVAPDAVEDASILDPSVFERASLPEDLDRTIVLDEQPVLVHRSAGKVRRSYSLPRDRVFAVGRAPQVNSLRIDDPTVSAQHFKVVPKDGQFYVVDLETTNGTWVNQDRVTVRRLAPGDLIRAGTAELEFQISRRRMN